MKLILILLEQLDDSDDLLFVVFLSMFDFMELAIASAAMGFLKTFIHLPVPLVLAEHLPKERCILFV